MVVLVKGRMRLMAFRSREPIKIERDSALEWGENQREAPNGGLPLVSIVIPTFNSSRTIRRTLESVRDQTWKNIEVIIVDYGVAVSSGKNLGPR